MGVGRKELEYVAEMARIYLDEEEGEKLVGDLIRILGYVDKLKELEVSGVEPMFHPFEFPQRLRKDEVKVTLNQEEALSNAPDKKDGFFRVPKIIDTF